VESVRRRAQSATDDRGGVALCLTCWRLARRVPQACRVAGSSLRRCRDCV
jgi:hypothetical protein